MSRFPAWAHILVPTPPVAAAPPIAAAPTCAREPARRTATGSRRAPSVPAPSPPVPVGFAAPPVPESPSPLCEGSSPLFRAGRAKQKQEGNLVLFFYSARSLKRPTPFSIDFRNDVERNFCGLLVGRCATKPEDLPPPSTQNEEVDALFSDSWDHSHVQILFLVGRRTCAFGSRRCVGELLVKQRRRR